MKVKKPIILHIRGPNATRAARSIMRQVGLLHTWPIHMHCFTSTWEDCSEWSQEWPEMKFGFTSDAFFAEVVQNLPLSKILLETDGPYFLPKKVS